jgi:hypothetical protein
MSRHAAYLNNLMSEHGIAPRLASLLHDAAARGRCLDPQRETHMPGWELENFSYGTMQHNLEVFDGSRDRVGRREGV